MCKGVWHVHTLLSVTAIIHITVGRRPSCHTRAQDSGDVQYAPWLQFQSFRSHVSRRYGIGTGYGSPSVQRN